MRQITKKKEIILASILTLDFMFYRNANSQPYYLSTLYVWSAWLVIISAEQKAGSLFQWFLQLLHVLTLKKVWATLMFALPDFDQRFEHSEVELICFGHSTTVQLSLSQLEWGWEQITGRLILLSNRIRATWSKCVLGHKWQHDWDKISSKHTNRKGKSIALYQH